MQGLEKGVLGGARNKLQRRREFYCKTIIQNKRGGVMGLMGPILVAKDFEDYNTIDTCEDRYRSPSSQRRENILFLKKIGFAESGLYSRSGVMYAKKLKSKYMLIFGKRYNICQKYFSLAKNYNDLKSLNKDLEIIKSNLKSRIDSI